MLQISASTRLPDSDSLQVTTGQTKSAFFATARAGIEFSAPAWTSHDLEPLPLSSD
eukprot:m.4531 g.4531  ORF g.4531 m.4531 type:complete len:56 (+) comp3083_c0_seq1:203-370(+)